MSKTSREIYLEVAVALPLFQTFVYKACGPIANFVKPGVRVLVPFGRRRVTGFIIGEGKPGGDYRIKNILDILEDAPLFPPSMIPFFKWMGEYYIFPIGEVIKSALPRGLTIADRTTLFITNKGLKRLEETTIPPKERILLSALKSGPCPQTMISNKIETPLSLAMVKRLADQGLLEKKNELVGRKTRALTMVFLSVENDNLIEDRFYEKRRLILDTIKNHGEISIQELGEKLPDCKGFVNFLIKSGNIKTREKEVYRDPFGEAVPPDRPPKLTKEQLDVVSTIAGTIGRRFSPYLLHGVTGSGKTEVYMQCASLALEKGMSALVLVPEIALISQTQRRFLARFGKNVAVLHSGLSEGEKFDQWIRILKKEAKIVIGARSAIFAPLESPGLIIVDEEHDGSYKQEGTLRYNARDMALVLGRMKEAAVLLGSATPSVQSFFNMENKKLTRLQLKKRVNNKPLPDITVVDMSKNDGARGADRLISPDLRQAMEETLGRGEQILLFLNRRGFASYPVCASCGTPVQCEHCDITLTLHKSRNAYICHLCGFSIAAVSECKKCGFPGIKAMGMGTEKIEAAARALFPQSSIARLDRDSASRKGSILKILKDLRKGKTDILVGTQMVAKGHDFPNITLVGIILADLSLSFPDFKSCEQTFQILAQVAGRAGRGDRPGRVVLQTFSPDHFTIKAAKDQDFENFYQKEIIHRKSFCYPPFCRLVQLKISGKDKGETARAAFAIGSACRGILEDDPSYANSIEILGPVEAPIAKMAGRYRRQILLKGINSNLLHAYVRKLMFSRGKESWNRQGISIVVDVDPVSMM